VKERRKTQGGEEGKAKEKKGKGSKGNEYVMSSVR